MGWPRIIALALTAIWLAMKLVADMPVSPIVGASAVLVLVRWGRGNSLAALGLKIVLASASLLVATYLLLLVARGDEAVWLSWHETIQFWHFAAWPALVLGWGVWLASLLSGVAARIGARNMVRIAAAAVIVMQAGLLAYLCSAERPGKARLFHAANEAWEILPQFGALAALLLTLGAWRVEGRRLTGLSLLVASGGCGLFYWLCQIFAPRYRYPGFSPFLLGSPIALEIGVLLAGAGAALILFAWLSPRQRGSDR